MMQSSLRLTPAVKILLIIIFAAFVIQQTGDQFFNLGITQVFGLVPRKFVLDFSIWQILTYGFLHADVMHILLNSLMLLFLGTEIEALWGWKRFLRYYLTCIFLSGFFYLILIYFWKDSALHTPLVGASGGIYGLLIAYGILFAERTLLFLMLFPMKAKHFIWVLAGVEFFTSLFSGRGEALSGIAHLGGMAGGFIYLWLAARRKIAARVKQNTSARKVSKANLKLVVNNPSGADKGGEQGKPPTWH